MAIERLVTARTLAAAIVVAACGTTTSLDQTWKPNTTPPEMHRVVTVMLSRDVTTRHLAEDRMTAKLRHDGIAAVQGYTVLSDADLDNRESAKARLLAAGYDGVIVMRIVGAQQELQYIPTYWGYSPGWYGPGWWGPGYGGYYDVSTVVRVETSAYSLSDGRLEYSALSSTTDPANVKNLIDSVTSKVTHALTKQRVVIATAEVK